MSAPTDPIDWLNQECFCITVDPAALRRELELDPSTRDLHATLAGTHPHLFARNPIFVGRGDVAAMQGLIEAVEAVVRLPQYREAVLAWAPPIAKFDPGTAGALSSFDFHLTPSGPKLIEINTNAGGAFLSAALARAQRACCAPVLESIEQSPGVASEDTPLPDRLFEMFMAEWRRQRGYDAVLRRIAIVDQAPGQQYLYPEFLLAAHLFRSHGIEAVICDPGALAVEQGVLRHASGAIDLVYNRLTDFALDDPAHAALRQAYLEGFAVVTPHPRAHALYADKRNLAILGDTARLREWGVDPATRDVLAAVIPETELVTVERAEELWARRRALFFKPVSGYGGKATYRGEKLTRRVWSEIVAGEYVAQALVPPSSRSVRIDTEPAAVTMKLDLRCYVYDGRILSLAARLYQGQVTNFRTPGGGFATVFSLP
jgi:hypothetical protein